MRTSGNADAHVILRGGKRGPNYEHKFVAESEALLHDMGLDPAILVDCSHDNSGKNHKLQRGVLESILKSVAAQREKGGESIVGFMVESNLFEGNQKIPQELSRLKYGISITDECVGWETTEEMLLAARDRMDHILVSEVDA